MKKFEQVQGIMGNGHMGTSPVERQTDRQTRMTENITLPQLCWQVVLNNERKNFDSGLWPPFRAA